MKRLDLPARPDRPWKKAADVVDLLLDLFYEPSKAFPDLHADVCTMLSCCVGRDAVGFFYVDELDAIYQRLEDAERVRDAVAADAQLAALDAAVNYVATGEGPLA